MSQLKRITATKAAEMLGMPLMAFTTLFKQGVFPFGKIYRTKSGGERYLIFQSEVENYINSKN